MWFKKLAIVYMSTTVENYYVLNGQRVIKRYQNIYADRRLNNYAYLSRKIKYKGKNLEAFVISEIDYAISLAKARTAIIKNYESDGFVSYSFYLSDKTCEVNSFDYTNYFVFWISYIKNVYKNCFIEKLQKGTMLYMSNPVYITSVEKVETLKSL